MTMHSMAAGLLALTLVFTPAGRATAAQEIPTSVTGSGPSAEYPDPICTKCKVKTVRSSRTATTHAFIEVQYLESVPFMGKIEVTVWFEDGGSDVVTIANATLSYGDVKWYETASNEGWTWDEVDAVELELVPLA